MSAAVDFLKQSRLVDLIKQVEQGEDVDLKRVAKLQALDLARLGEVFVVEALEREEQADEQLR